MPESSYALYSRKGISMSKENVISWRQRVKIKLIEYKGGKCSRCGYNKDVPRAYQFHHRDSSQKDFQIGGKSLSFQTLKKEVDKCDLVCSNCHAEIHDLEVKEKRDELRQRHQQWLESLLQPKNCKQCNKEFQPEKRDAKFCSAKCSQMSQRRCSRPTKAELRNMMTKMSWTAIGKKYGISCNAVRKWAKTYGLLN